MKFPLQEQKLGGYDYGVKTSYSQQHLGVDWKADFVTGVAPKAGLVIKTTNGVEGGFTMWFKPTGEQTIIRWLHLSKFLVLEGTYVKEGDPIFVTGNSGTDGNGHKPIPHLHEDMWPRGNVTLLFKDTMNPHDYYKKSLINDGTMFRTHNGTIYLLAAGFWLAIATSYEQFLSDFGGVTAPSMTDEQFKAFPVTRPTIK